MEELEKFILEQCAKGQTVKVYNGKNGEILAVFYYLNGAMLHGLNQYESLYWTIEQCTKYGAKKRFKMLWN